MVSKRRRSRPPRFFSRTRTECQLDFAAGLANDIRALTTDSELRSIGQPRGLSLPDSRLPGSRYTVAVEQQKIAGRVLREITTHSAEETIAFGRALADLVAPPRLVLLRGDLGAGKTTLVKGIAAAFDAAAEQDVTSPTFTLVHEYRGPRATLYHIDLYRIDTPRELDTLALDDLRSENSILLIEWGEKFPWLLLERDVEIALRREGETDRSIRVMS